MAAWHTRRLTPRLAHDTLLAMGTIRHLYRYPVKGLSAEPLDLARLEPGQTIAFDRAYAIENGPGRFDPDVPRHLPKINFLMLMRHEKLAGLSTEFDDATHTLSIRRDGKQVARGALNTRLGRQMIEQFMAGYMAGDLKGPPRIVSAPGHSFSDVADKCVHIVNLETIRALGSEFGRELHPLRFRANIYVDGIDPWREFDWLDRELVAGDARLEVFARTPRCDAVNVDPQTAMRDIGLPPDMMRALGHNDLGVYARVTGAGTLRLGDQITTA
jgi:uncharacterized protein YcbX